MSDGFHKITVTDPAHAPVTLLVVLPIEEDAWGVLSPLKNTIWGTLIREVSGESLAHARHGYMTPLMNEIGPAPKHLAKLVPDKDGKCTLTRKGACAASGPHCRPGPKLPDCYEPPGVGTGVLQELLAKVVLAWRDDVYVVVVIGLEFNLL